MEPSGAAGAGSGADVGARLVALLKTVADKGLIYDPQTMADVLRLGIHLSERKTLSKFGDGGNEAPTIIPWAKFDDSWYKPEPEGIHNMKFPRKPSSILSSRPASRRSVSGPTVRALRRRGLRAHRGPADLRQSLRLLVPYARPVQGADRRGALHGDLGAAEYIDRLLQGA
jgi:hypothetical protein